MKKKKWLMLTLGIGAIVFLIIARVFFVQKDNGKPTVVAELALTGSVSYLGEESKAGIDAATQLLKEEGLFVNVQYEDSAFNVRTALQVFQRILSQKNVKGVVVTHSAIASPVAEFVNMNKIRNQDSLPVIMTSLSFSSQLTKNNMVCVRCFPSASDDGYLMAKYANDGVNCRRMVVLFQNDDYGNEAANAFMKAAAQNGIHVLFASPYDDKPNNQKDLAIRACSLNPDGIYIVGATPAFITLVRTIKSMDFRGYLLSGAGVDVKSVRESIGNDAIKGLVYPSVFSDHDALQDNYRYCRYKELLKQYKKSPNMINIYTAIPFMVLCELIHKYPNKTSTELVECIKNREIDTIIGKINFDSERGAILPLYIKQMIDVNPENDILISIVR